MANRPHVINHKCRDIRTNEIGRCQMYYDGDEYEKELAAHLRDGDYIVFPSGGGDPKLVHPFEFSKNYVLIP